MTPDFSIVFALYPRVTQVDFTGPYEVLARLPRARAILASVTGGSIEADGGITFGRVLRLADLERCDLLCVPGGFGTVEARDGNVMTGGGVTAGIDLALGVVAEIMGRDFAEAVQLGIEYAPAPPFAAGRPEMARPEILATVRGRFDAVRALREAACRRAASRP